MLRDAGTAVPFVPAASAVLIVLVARHRRGLAARIGVGGVLIALVGSLVALGSFLAQPTTVVVHLGSSWGSLWLDPLSLVLWAFVSGISVIVHRYSVRAMVEEAGYGRFFALLNAMTATILFLVAAADLITLLAAWFLVGVFLYFLLGHDLERPAAGRYALWTKVIYRLGDLPLWLAAIVLFRTYHSISLPVLFARMGADPHATTLGGLSAPALTGILVALAGFARSAQILLHSWLPYTMDGPTPVSALMHAGIVNAAGFLFNRFAPVFEIDGLGLHLALVVGLLSALIGSSLMLIQNDVKRSLGYSTMGQMGFMVMECGLGALPLAVFHLIAHGFFKASSFLSAGDAIGEARAHDGVPPDLVYSAIVTRRPTRFPRLPLWIAGSLILVVPVVVFSLAHAAVARHLLFEQGVIVLLFFAWVTGGQALLRAHRLSRANPWKVMGGILVSFVLVVIGYTLVTHVFGSFLEPGAASTRLYRAASLGFVPTGALVAVLALLFAAGWALAVLVGTERLWSWLLARWHAAAMAGYALLTRELYLNDLAGRVADAMVHLSRWLNLVTWWS
ncbi:proton-conducting transporter membrane subunit [Aciditerrimonas ferrireducens]|uniref:Proton-conducting transporter membrane subunit n=1 Tax=Aciditerrimonas ferrireducens TaxID=667306 RepID=A0ABV6C1F8_9ACTN